MPRVFVSLLAAAFSGLAATCLHAQDRPSRAIALVGGGMEYDLSGTGTAGFGGLRVELPQSHLFLVELGATVARPSMQST